MSVTIGWDATHANLASAPKTGQAAGYRTGSGGVAWTAADAASHPGWVQIAQAVDLVTDEHAMADVLDVEQGAATFGDCAPWARDAMAKFAAGTRPGQRRPAIYCSMANA